MIAFEKFKEIEVLADTIDKHKMWLEDYKGLNYSVAVEGKHLMKWQTEPKEYKIFEPRINCIARHPKRCVIEFDGEESSAKENLETTAKKLKELGYGFIRSTHKGKSDYLWVEFSRNMKDKEIEQFLFWIAPKGSKVDLNFASSKKVFPILFAVHWKHSYQREMPVEFFEGNQIDFNSLGIATTNVPKKTIRKEDFEYEVAEKDYSPEEIEQAKKEVYQCYLDIVSLMKEYLEMKEDDYKLIALWILGTYVHKSFNTYPYLFLNAMRGSGKTRLLKFISALAKNADIVADIREAVLFRTAMEHTIIIDEFEHINSKDKGVLRELLNAGYKKGIKVKRMKKVFKNGSESQEVEEFELYTPIVMANIHGMNEVLGDRCLTIILEKSHNPFVTKMAEDFDFNQKFAILRNQCMKCSVCCSKNVYGKIISDWNSYIKSLTYTDTLHTYNTLSYTSYTNLFKKIFDSDINGRNFELMFPLFLLSHQIKPELFEEILGITTKIVKARQIEEFAESKDVALIDFVSHQIQWQMEYVGIKAITTKFREFLDEGETDDKWLKEEWIGRALKRLNLVLEKRRVAKGIEIMLDIVRSKEKIKMFKEAEVTPK